VALARAVTQTFALQAEQKQIRLDFTSDDEDAFKIRADPLKLSWVVSNLIANALRYTPAGGTISVSCSRGDAGPALRVADSGPGIPPDLREHLFERYAQWSVNGAEPGSAGLGLAIAKEIVEAHRGRIFVQSEPGAGTRFTVELPAAPEVIADGAPADRR
jgi:signal transduction histidine kinase